MPISAWKTARATETAFVETVITMSVTVLTSPMRAFTTVCATAAVSEGTINKISPSAVPMARSASRWRR